QAAELTGQGVYAEVTANQLLRQPGCDAACLAAFVASVGYDRVVLSSDAGQPDNPRPPEALQLLVDALAAAGLDRQALLACASDIPERLVTPLCCGRAVTGLKPAAACADRPAVCDSA